ncbi:MAG: FixH family protein [Bdellovibrionales bacterium]|nr:FixH family protein [Bdellovibrionales bacterium]
MMSEVHKPLSYYAWPMAIIGALLSVGIAGTITIRMALDAKTDLIDESPYDQGIAYQGVIDELSRGKSLNLLQGFEVIKVDSGYMANLSISQTTPPFSQVLLQGAFPPDSALDTSATLMLPSENAQEVQGPINISKPGLWLFTIIFERDGERARYERRIFVP